MTRYVVEIAPLAEGDIKEAYLWYLERNALIAQAFRTEVLGVIDKVEKAPLSKAPDDEGNRRRLLRRFPYSVVYELHGATVTILAVTHHRRQPNYWRTQGH